MTRWKMTVEYDGGRYSGWQRQDGAGVTTIQQVIEDAIFGYCQQRLTAHVAGRTDAGVHALGQVFHVDLPERDITPFELGKAINAHLFHARERVAVMRAEKVGDDFHARFSARSKLYTYRILRRSAPPTVDFGKVWHFRRDLDVAAMRAGAAHLLGIHDFTTFRDSQCQAKSPVKTLDRIELETVGDEIRVHVEGRSFLHHQVRNMVGTLTLVGDGKWQPDDIRTALEARDRAKGGPTAPPDGLYLVRIDY